MTLLATVLPVFYARADDRSPWMVTLLVLQTIGYLGFTIALLRLVKTFGSSPQCNEEAFILMDISKARSSIPQLNNPVFLGKFVFITEMLSLIVCMIWCWMMHKDAVSEVCLLCLLNIVK